MFDDSGWPYDDLAKTLALTTVNFSVDDIELTPDDEAGLCAIYPPASSPSGGRSCAVQPLPADDEPLGFVGAALFIIGVLFTRGATRRRLLHQQAVDLGPEGIEIE